MMSQLNLSSSTIRIFPTYEFFRSSFGSNLKSEEPDMLKFLVKVDLTNVGGPRSCNLLDSGSHGSVNSISGTLMSPFLYLSIEPLSPFRS